MDTVTTPSYKEGLQELRQNLRQILPADSLSIFDNDAVDLDDSLVNILSVKKGDTAPDFNLLNATGENVRLYDKLESHRIVLVFYRGTWCPYCNLALSQYQSILPSIHKAGATLIAISPQTPDQSLNIKEKNELSFEVLSDNGNMVARLYTKVFQYKEKPLAEMSNLGFDFDSFYSDDSHEIPVPAVFIIEQNGEISFAKTEGGDYRNRTEAKNILLHLTATT